MKPQLGISAAGMCRLAQVFDEPEYSGSRDVLLENTVSRLLEHTGIELMPDEVQEMIDTVNHNPSGERVLSKELKNVWRFSSADAEKVLDVIAWAAHEMLDYDYEDKLSQEKVE